MTVSVEDGGEYALWYESIKDEFEKETGATVNLEGASNEAVLSEAMAKSGYYGKCYRRWSADSRRNGQVLVI